MFEYGEVGGAAVNDQIEALMRYRTPPRRLSGKEAADG